MRSEVCTSKSKLGAAVLIVSCLASATAWATPFLHETVDAAVNVGPYTSLALDAQGNPHLGYYDITFGNLKYARKSVGVWTLEIVESTGDVGSYASLAVDAQGNPRISYQNSTSQDLKYASKSGGVWTRETVDSAGSVGLHTAIAVDALGNPRISYHDITNGDLKYASKSGGVWTLETVDTGGGGGTVGLYSSLPLGSPGDTCVSYYDDTNDDLKFATKSAGVWTLEVVDSVGDVGRYTSLALDAQGNPRIAYQDATSLNLKFASKSGGVWTLETVDAAGDVGTFASLAMDALGNPRISYRDGTNLDLKYASKTAGGWTSETVDAALSVGNFCSLALDSQGNPRIGYMDFANQDLKYTDSAVHLVSPSGGETWPVGALRTLIWSGAGIVDVFLSADGGASSTLLLDNVQGATVSNEVTFRVPHLPTRFAHLEVQRATPFSTGPSDSLFTIETSIALLSFTADPPSESSPGVRIAWSTNPGPEDLAGYRVERRHGEGTWQEMVSLTRETSVEDPMGAAGTAYQLTAVNGLGEELVLGDVQVAPSVVLAAWPLPYRGGSLTISFATYGGLLSGRGAAEVDIYDAAGRLVRRVARGTYSAGLQMATWNGRDESGTLAVSGVYFLRSTTGGATNQRKLVVLR